MAGDHTNVGFRSWLVPRKSKAAVLQQRLLYCHTKKQRTNSPTGSPVNAHLISGPNISILT